MTEQPTGQPEGEKNFLTLLWGEVLVLAGPVLAAYDPWHRARLMRDLGWDLEAVSGMDAAAFEDWVKKVGPAIENLSEAIADLKRDELGDLIKIGEKAGEAFGALGSLPPALQGKLPEIDGRLAEELGDDLLDHLILAYLLRRVPWTVPGLELLGLVTPAREQPPSVPMPAGDAPIRLPKRRDELHLERIADGIADPEGYFKSLYAPQGVGTPEAVDAMAARVLPRLTSLLNTLGVDAAYGVRKGIGPDLGEAGLRLSEHLMRVKFGGNRTPGGRPPDGTAALAAGPDAADPGAEVAALAGPWTPTFGVGLTIGFASWDGKLVVILMPTGEAHLEGSFGTWNVAADLTGAGPAFAFGKDGLTVNAGAMSIAAAVEVARIAPEGSPGWVIGAPDGTHVAIGQLVLKAHGSLGAGRDDVGVQAAAGRAEVVVKAGDGDGLLAKLLPKDGITIGFDLGVGWSLRTGMHLAGAAALAAEYPMHLSRWGVHIEGLRIAIEGSSATKAVYLTVSTSVRAEIGPVRAVVHHIGVRGELTFPPLEPSVNGGKAGNLGRANLAPKFKVPDGVGLRVEGGLVSGGGYLFIDEPRGMYAGVLQLGVSSGGDAVTPLKGFMLQVVAILNTKKPDGTPLTEADGGRTFSLLMVGTFTWFPGIVLFWGISITGLGLVFGHNRRSNPDEVRNAARGGTLDSLLFPADPVGNAPAVISSLSRMFPVDTTGTVVGAMVRLSFLKDQVTADLAVIVEFPAPIRILLLGKLVIDFKAAGKFRLDSAGIVDFGTREITLDAALVDSKLFGRPVSGEMALRSRWGDNATFAVSIGGWNPRYTPPAGFPALKRFEIALQKSGKGLKLQAYLAVTGNSVQFGAALTLRFEAMGLVIDGRAWLDVMFQFKPFWFTAELGATVTLKYKDKELLAVLLRVDLSGPHPWKASGEAKVKILAWEVGGSFTWQHGSATTLEQPSQVSASELLKQALTGTGAWDTGQAVPGVEPGALRAIEAPDGTAVLHPSAVLGVRQNVFPLEETLQRIGTSRIAGSDRFSISRVTVREAGVTLEAELGDVIYDGFAPGQFRDLSLIDMIVSPPSLRLPAGREVKLPEGTALPDDGLVVAVDLSGDEAYDRVIIDDPDAGGRAMPATVTRTADAGGLLATFAAVGPAANANTRDTPTRFGVSGALLEGARQ